MSGTGDDIRRYLCSRALRGNDLLLRCGTGSVEEEEEPGRDRAEPEAESAGQQKKREMINIEDIETGIVYNSSAPLQDGLFGSQSSGRQEGSFSGCGIEELAGKVAGCRLCRLSESRTNTVFGTGDPGASVVFVGEAPGKEEDLSGEPFVGRAGKLLDRILDAIDFSREQVYIANILKCRPPNNRDPNENEVSCCEPYLQRQLELIEPEVICALGRIAAQTLLRSKSALGKMRGKIHYYNGIKLIATYHPAALLRNPNFKRPAWEDMKMLRAICDSS
jgi:DNA polymerase